jgi:ribosomal protein L10
MKSVSKNRQIKETLIEDFSQKLKNKSIVIVGNKSITSNAINNLRAQARENNIYVTVMNNNLAKIALKNLNKNEEFCSKIKDNNIFMVCNDAVEAIGLLSILTPNTFSFYGYHDSKNNYSIDSTIASKIIPYKTLKNVISSNLGLIQEPLMQMKSLLEKIGSSQS